MDFGITIQNYSVFQRNQQNVSDHPFCGTSTHDGIIQLTVRSGKTAVPGFERVSVGTATRHCCSGVVKGLPAGGPYTLEFTLESSGKSVTEQIVFSDVLVGDLWILAGQSNMQGRGFFPEVTPVNPMLHNFFMDNRWGIADENLHNISQAAAPVHGGNPKSRRPRNLSRGVGPGMSFAAEMYARTGVPQGTIACAHGGTTMDQWSPKLRKLGGHSLYGAMMERFEALGSRVAGIIWSQGGNDAFPGVESARAYEKKTRAFLKAVRRDFGDETLPIVIAQLGTQLTPDTSHAAWTIVRQAQYDIGRTVSHTACVSTMDLELDDRVHFSASAQSILGKRMADAMQYLQGAPGGHAPIEVGKLRYLTHPVTGLLVIELAFKNVVGKLISGSLPHGFSTVDRALTHGTDCFQIRIHDNNHVRISTSILPAFADRDLLAYGFGTRDYCNITDEAGRALPAFIREIKPLRRGMTPMATVAEVCEMPLAAKDSAEALTLPPDGVKFIPAVFNEFYLTHPRRAELAHTGHQIYYFRFRTENAETMEIKGHFGSDGPLAVFCDGKAVLRTDSTNPLQVDQFTTHQTLSAGQHEWVMTLGNNAGNAWGVCARFEALHGKSIAFWAKKE